MWELGRASPGELYLASAADCGVPPAPGVDGGSDPAGVPGVRAVPGVPGVPGVRGDRGDRRFFRISRCAVGADLARIAYDSCSALGELGVPRPYLHEESDGNQRQWQGVITPRDNTRPAALHPQRTDTPAPHVHRPCRR